MAASISDELGPTYDEPAHLTAGYAYWRHGDFRFQPENGNLPQRLAALPLLTQNVQFPAPPPADAVADVSAAASQFLFKSGNDPESLLAASRWMIALLSALLCALVYAWSRSLWGDAGGWLALGLAVFSPTLLAHGGLVTSDTAAATGFAAALLAWWRVCHRVTVGRVVLAGLAAGALALAKYSAALFAPMALLLLLVRLARKTPLPVACGRWRHRWAGISRVGPLTAAGVVAAVIAIGLIWFAYGFRYSASPHAEVPARFLIPWDTVMMEGPPAPIPLLADGTSAMPETVNREPGVVQRFVSLARAYHLLPEAYLYGLATVDRYSRARLAYFAGEYRSTGWPEFFPTAFLLKTTLPALALMLGGLLALGTGAGRGRRLYRATPLIALLVVYWTFSILSHLNIGHRHLMPVYPASFIVAGAMARWMAQRRIVASLTWLLVGVHLGASWSIRPYYLAYFNPLAGGPEMAHRLFVDSSLDWGQDLPSLKRWLDQHAGGEAVYLSYFGTDEPQRLGINAVRFGDTYFDAPRAVPAPVGPGIYCISATMLRRVYTHVRGPWSPAYEAAYQRLDAWVRSLGSLTPGGMPTDQHGNPLSREEVRGRLLDYEHLQFGRLCHYLEQRAPDARAGYSILIYRLNAAEFTLALNGLGQALAQDTE